MRIERSISAGPSSRIGWLAGQFEGGKEGKELVPSAAAHLLPRNEACIFDS